MVIMGLGPLVEGYCLIITKEHQSCCAAIPSGHLPEFRYVLAAVQASQQLVFGSSLFFEHGRNGGCLPNGHDDDLCYHAHLHVIPSTINLAAAVRADYATDSLPSWEQVVLSNKRRIVPYLVVQDGPELAYVPDPQGLPGRYLRTKAAKLLFGDSLLADWQAFPAYDTVRSGKALLEDTLRKTWHSIQSTNRAPHSPQEGQSRW